MKTRVLDISRSLYIPSELCMKFKLFSYPSGERHIEISDDEFICKSKPKRIIIASNMTTPDDIMSTFIATDVLRKSFKDTSIELLSPYFPYVYGTSRYGTKDMNIRIIPELIKSVGYDKIHLLSPFDPPDHFKVDTFNVLHEFTNLNVIDDLPFVESAIDVISKFHDGDLCITAGDGIVTKKTTRLAELLKLDELAFFSAFNKSTGETTIEHIGDVKENCIIFDDLCNSGDQTIKIAKSVKNLGAKYVHFVTPHAFFSKGVDNLLRNGIDSVHITDSCYSDVIKFRQHHGLYVHHIAEFSGIFGKD
jgi:ribose-phosphate pyrophosphokinase